MDTIPGPEKEDLCRPLSLWMDNEVDLQPGKGISTTLSVLRG